MGKPRTKPIVSFQAKVLVPVIAVMVLLLAVTVWVVDRRITQQFEVEARHTLATADAVFRYSQEIRIKNLLLRFDDLPNELRFKTFFLTGHPETLREFLQEVLGEQGVHVVLFTGDDGKLIAAAKRDPLLTISAFEKACAPTIQRALQGAKKADTVRAGDQLYDVVSIPVTGVSGTLIGALTFGSELDATAVQEFRLLTHSQVVLLTGGQVIASTLESPEAIAQFSDLFNEIGRGSNAAPMRLDENGAVKSVVLGGKHYFCSGGRFNSLGGNGTLGYLLLSSYEQSWQALQTTKELLLQLSLAAILAGATVVWLFVRKVTAPLRELRDSAEAVGCGDFSRHVEARSRDECGELTCAFNQMTQNLKQSREQLEQTVETLKTTQAQLVQSEKLSGIGEFIAGVAHELNNPLTSVMGFSELLRQSDQDPQHLRQLELIHKSAQRCQKIVQALLSFARRHPPERKPVCVNSLIEATLEVLQYQLRTSNVDIIARFDPNLPLAMVDPHQIQQVFLNILNNARQAIEAHRPEGWIRITTETCDSTVRITIQDNGPGIAPENISKIFDPFFTTKEVGAGTGLGLSLCYGIIKEHGGTITPRSKPGEGATFIIELPIMYTPPPGKNEGTAEMEIITSREGAGKRVLVIDDEEAILQMAREALTRQGYQVDVATDGEAGLRRLSQTHYDVTLCDWKMPGLNGQQVFERIQTQNPALTDRIIFMTGDTVSSKTRGFFEEGKRICLPKPFTLAEFRAAIAKVLAASRVVRMADATKP